MLLPHLALVATWDLAENLAATLLCFAGAVFTLLWARSWRPVPSVRVILLVAAALRLLLVPLPLTLSNDALRYVWDGKVAGAGHNPYELAPEAPELAHLRDGLWQELDHRDVPTVYPPLALTFFAIAARFPWPIVAWKLIIVLADLVGCYFLCRIATLRGHGKGAVIWYAWNPLATLEGAGMGHLDAVGVCWVVIVVWALAAKRETSAAALAAAASVLTKLVPAVVVPAWILQSRSPLRFAGLGVLSLGFAFAPVVMASGGVPQGYVRFGVSWEFNGPLYEPLWRAFERVDSSGVVERALDRQKTRTGEHEFWNRLYPWNYARMHARLVLAGLLAVLLVAAWRRSAPEAATGLALEAVLLCSATVYPWYLLWLLPFAALERRSAWLVLCCSGIIAYVPQFTEVPLMPWVFALLWGPYALLRLSEVRWSGA